MAHGNIGVAKGILYQILAGNGWFRTCGAKRSPRRGKSFPEQYVEEINHNDADDQSYYHLSYFTPNDFSDEQPYRGRLFILRSLPNRKVPHDQYRSDDP